MKIINSILWSISIIMLLGGGLYYTFKLKFLQFRIIEMFKNFKTKEKTIISPFKSLTMALSARIGVGSLAGIALAIYVGGVGTIFWIWVSAIITSINVFAESCLGTIYKEKDKDICKGGPSFYIDKGLGNKKLAKIYAIIIVLAYIFGFISIQANTISTSLYSYIELPKIITGVIIAIVTAIIIFKGVKQIANVSATLVPIMGIIYILMSLYIIIKNYMLIPDIIIEIFLSAFNYKALGAGIFSSMLIGIQRGVFSTEAGIGSGAIASSTVNTNNAVGQGLIQILGIHFTTFVICTSTALIILTSNYQQMSFDTLNGIEITQYALKYHLGDLGIIILIFSIISFAYSTIIAGYYYGENSLKYLKENITKTKLNIFKIIVIILIIIGSIINPSIIWNLVDIAVGIMAIINMYAILKLKKVVIEKYNYYRKRKYM